MVGVEVAHCGASNVFDRMSSVTWPATDFPFASASSFALSYVFSLRVTDFCPFLGNLEYPVCNGYITCIYA